MVPLMAEAGVAHRTIGQQSFGFSQRERPRSTLDEIAVLIDLEPIATLLGRIRSNLEENHEPGRRYLRRLTKAIRER